MRLLRDYYRLGVRYMTLSWSNTNEWADSSGDIDNPKVQHHNGLTDFGKHVVLEMNRLGMMVDISHVSDKTFWDAIATTKAPVIASHSSCRAICDHPRNMTDNMMRELAAKNGVIQINYHEGFLSQEFRDAEKADPKINAAIELEVSKRCGTNEACQLLEGDRLTREAVEQGKLPQAWQLYHEGLRISNEKSLAALPPLGFMYVGLGELCYEWNDLPREVLGEGIVLNVSQNSATVLITTSRSEIFAGDYAELE